MLRRALVSLAAVAAALQPAVAAEPFRFGVLGDIPYNRFERQHLPRLLAEMDAEGLRVVVHDGDLKNGGERCDDALYADRLALFGGDTLSGFAWLMIAFSAWLNPFYLGLAAGAGEAIGEFVIYTAGRTGHAFFLKDRFIEAQTNKESHGVYPRLQRWIHAKGSLALFLSSAIWNPFFSLISATAGATRFPAWKFLGSVWAGKTLKWTIIALLGYAVFGQLVKRIVEWIT